MRTDGFTLLELMTVVAIVAVLGSSLFGVARRAAAEEGRLAADHRALGDLREALSAVERDLRVAAAVEVSSGCLTTRRFDGTRITWRVGGGRLLREDVPLLDSVARFDCCRAGNLVTIGVDLAGRYGGRTGTRVESSVRVRGGEGLR